MTLDSGKGGARFLRLAGDNVESRVAMEMEALANPDDCSTGFTLTFTAQVRTCERD